MVWHQWGNRLVSLAHLSALTLHFYCHGLYAFMKWSHHVLKEKQATLKMTIWLPMIMFMHFLLRPYLMIFNACCVNTFIPSSLPRLLMTLIYDATTQDLLWSLTHPTSSSLGWVCAQCCTSPERQCGSWLLKGRQEPFGEKNNYNNRLDGLLKTSFTLVHYTIALHIKWRGRFFLLKAQIHQDTVKHT